MNSDNNNSLFHIDPTPSKELDQQGKLEDLKIPNTDSNILLMALKIYERAIPIIGRLWIGGTSQESWGHLVSPLPKRAEFKTAISDCDSLGIFIGEVTSENGALIFNTDGKNSDTESDLSTRWNSVVLNPELQNKIRETKEGIAISDEEVEARLMLVTKAYQERTIMTGFLNSSGELLYKPGCLYPSSSSKLAFMTYTSDLIVKKHYGNVFEFDGRLYFVESPTEENPEVINTTKESNCNKEEKTMTPQLPNSSEATKINLGPNQRNPAQCTNPNDLIMGYLGSGKSSTMSLGTLISETSDYSEFLAVDLNGVYGKKHFGKTIFSEGKFIFIEMDLKIKNSSISGAFSSQSSVDQNLASLVSIVRRGDIDHNQSYSVNHKQLKEIAQSKKIITGFLIPEDGDNEIFVPGHIHLTEKDTAAFKPCGLGIPQVVRHGVVAHFQGQFYFVEQESSTRMILEAKNWVISSRKETQQKIELTEMVLKNSDVDLKKVAGAADKNISPPTKDDDILSWTMAQGCSLFASEEALRLLRTTKNAIRGLTFNQGKVLGTIGEMTDGGFVIFSFVKDNSVSYVEGRVMLTEKLGPVFFEQQANMNYMATSYVKRGAKVSAIIDGVSYDYNGQGAEALVAHLRRIGAV